MTVRESSRLILTNTSPRREKLKQLTWDTNGPQNVPEAGDYWPITRTVTANNYYINSYNLTVEPTTGYVIVPGIKFKQPCHYSEESY